MSRGRDQGPGIRDQRAEGNDKGSGIRGRGWALVRVVVVCVLGMVMLGAGDPEARFQRMGHNLMCPCGCAEVLLECNHVGCPDSAGMIGELRGKLEGDGDSDGAILKWFAAKYGATVLAAPLRGGFDVVAWVTPIAVLVLAIVGTALMGLAWKRRRVDLAAAGGAGGMDAMDRAMRERIRRETEY